MIYYTSRIKHNNKMMTDKYYKNATLVDQVEEKLKDYIMSLEPKPGDQLPNEQEMAESLNVSRSVLREVLSRFKMMGLISSRPKRGMILTEPSLFEGMRRVVDPRLMSEESIFNLLGFRIALEIGICGDIFRNRTDRALDELAEIVDMGIALGNNVYANISEHAFHTKLYEMTGNRVISQFQDIVVPVIEYINTNFGSYMRCANSELEKEGGIVTHEDLFMLLKEGDEAGFRDAMERHFLVYRRLIEDRAKVEGQSLMN